MIGRRPCRCTALAVASWVPEARSVLRVLVLSALAIVVPATAAAQEPGVVYSPADPEVSDTEVIRWAARELGRADGREVDRHPPPPPSDYVARDPSPEPIPSLEPEGGVRVLAEIGGGALGMTLGGGLGALLVWAALEGNASPEWTLIAGGAATVLTSVGITTGVALAAEATGSRAGFGHAFIGQAIGALAAVPLVVLAFHEGVPEAGLVPATLFPLGGAVIAYEIAHALSSSSAAAPPVVAYLVPTSSGVLGGVAGTMR